MRHASPLTVDPAPPSAGVHRRVNRQLGALVKGLLSMRLAWLAVTVVVVGRGVAWRPGMPLLVAAAAVASLAPLWHWHRLAPRLLAAPAWLAADLAIGLTVLVASAASGPLVHFTLTTAALAGLVFGWWGAAAASVLLGGSCLLVLEIGGLGPGIPGLPTPLGLPMLYPMAAVAAAGVRVLVDRQAAAEDALATAEQRLAVGRERARLARDMHDSLAAELNGLALSAQALKGSAVRDPQRAEETAEVVAMAATSAAAQVREIIGDLRLDARAPLHRAALDTADRWARRTGIPVLADARPAPIPPRQAAELLAILQEALRNVERHARATSVLVTLIGSEDGTVLIVTDDGIGLAEPAAPEDYGRTGRYGLIGMRERAESIGGNLRLDSTPGTGLTVTVTVPASSATQGH